MAKMKTESYALRERRAVRDLAVAVICDPASTPDDKIMARQRLHATQHGIERDLDEWVRNAPSGMLHELRALLAKYAAIDRAITDDV
jgi:hypothetical protein